MSCQHATWQADAGSLPLPRFRFCDGCPALSYTTDGGTWSPWVILGAAVAP